VLLLQGQEAASCTLFFEQPAEGMGSSDNCSTQRSVLLGEGLIGPAEVNLGLWGSWKLEKNGVLRLSSAVPNKY